MKFLRQGLALAVIGAGLASVPALTPSASAAAPDNRGVVQRMKDEAKGAVRYTTESATGKVGFIAARGASADLMPGRSASDTASAAAKATAYLDQYGAAFGATKGQLVKGRTLKSPYGWDVSYRQQYRGVDVFGAVLKAHVDAQGDLVAVAGYAAPGLDLSVTPAKSAAEAEANAVRTVKAEPPTTGDGKSASTAGVKATDSQLFVYRMGAIRGVKGDAVLAYQVEVTNQKNVRDMVFVDATTGKIVNRYSMMTDSLQRELYEADPDGNGYPDADLVWQEGDDFPGDLNEDQQNLVQSGGESYWLYRNTFGRDSYDGEGAVMRTVNNDPTIDCPNANWNGLTTNYCDGVTSDDVVSHEWGHAYTEYTSGLVYQFQPGALNESYSDVWGETVDQINGREDEGESFDTKREVGTCDPTAPAKLEVAITAPESAAGPCTAAEAGFGPGYDTTPDEVTVVVSTDPANDAGPTTTDGCSPYTNAAAVDGNYAYADRGGCTFQAKVDNAAAAGATGLVVGNSQPGLPISMSGTADIPGIMVTQADGTRIKGAGEPVTMTIAAEDTSSRADTTRWLIGEKSTAFGGAIRDMWNPTCYADPGKVSDAEYECDPNNTDSGGVHSNSGVPNHAYALLTDGGTFNGYSIDGIGLDKAANIWWYAQSTYLTPTSDFTAAADALQQSCADLTGQPITKLSTAANATPESADPITAADCTSVADTMSAVEMRTQPTQCNFKPLLDKDTPSLCGDGFDTEKIWSEDFEDGLAGWTADQELADLPQYGYQGGFGAPWEATSDAPGDHAGGVAYGPAPDRGQCTGDGETDFSSRDGITGPVVVMPATGARNPRLSFDHYVATEAGYDGGNVKLSINGGDFTAIPAGAYIFNGPKTLTTLGGGSTNPLAGQPGFTGTDGGKVVGSWGTSQVDLSAVGVKPGDTVQVKLDIGRDGCGGIDGWYLDNVAITVCRVGTDVTATHAPEPSTYGKPSRVDVTVSAAGDAQGASPTGRVVLRDEDGDRVGAAQLVDGEASIALPSDLPVGTHVMTATYQGDATFASRSTDVTVTVKGVSTPPTKARTTTQVVKYYPRPAKFHQNFTVKVKVSSSAGQVHGRVAVYRKGHYKGSSKVVNGYAWVTVKNRLPRGSSFLFARYKGSAQFKPSGDGFRVVVR